MDESDPGSGWLEVKKVNPIVSLLFVVVPFPSGLRHWCYHRQLSASSSHLYRIRRDSTDRTCGSTSP